MRLRVLERIDEGEIAGNLLDGGGLEKDVRTTAAFEETCGIR